MHRCASLAAVGGGPSPLRRLTLLAVILAGIGLTWPCATQAQQGLFRRFPANALRAEMLVIQPPAVALNGKPARLAPGARVRDEGNIIQLTGNLAGRKAVVNYTTDLEGQLLDVWILTPEEQARKPWPTSPEQLATWRFDFDSQTWTSQ